MDEIVNTFLLTWDKFVPELQLKNLTLCIVLVEHLLSMLTGLKNRVKMKQVTQNIF